MTKVIFDISMSLDGFVTASNVRPEEPMGDGGQRLHEWASGEDDRNRRLLEDAIAGRTTYDTSLPWWGRTGQRAPLGGPCSLLPTTRPPRRRRGECTRSSPTASRAHSSKRRP